MPLAGTRDGAPDAIQVADRFHLWKNPVRGGGENRGRRLAGRTRRLAGRTRARYAEVQECLARGLSCAATARELNPGIQTVRRFANAACAEELPGKAEHRATKLDPCIDLVS